MYIHQKHPSEAKASVIYPYMDIYSVSASVYEYSLFLLGWQRETISARDSTEIIECIWQERLSLDL